MLYSKWIQASGFIQLCQYGTCLDNDMSFEKSIEYLQVSF